MSRKALNQWKVPIDSYNRTMPFYVECDCGKLAEKVYMKPYFDCPMCKRRYALSRGAYVEIKKNK